MAAAATLKLAATRDELTRCDAWFQAFAAAHALPERAAAEVRLCLHELAANIALHGSATRICLRVVLERGQVVITIIDDSTPFDPVVASTAPLSGPLEDAAIGGLGLHLVHRTADVLAYRRRGDWNEVRLIRRLGQRTAEASVREGRSAGN